MWKLYWANVGFLVFMAGAYNMYCWGVSNSSSDKNLLPLSYRRPIQKIVSITFNNKIIHMFESFPNHDRHPCRAHITMPLETNAQVLATTFDATRRFCNLVMVEAKTFDADILHVQLSFD